MTSANALPDDCCLVLMMKSAVRSKRRLAAQIGDRATQAAQLLIDCAHEDLAAWQGPVCLAPSELDDEPVLNSFAADAVVLQSGANLGARINHVNAQLCARGFERQVFIGIDCPAIDHAYLDGAARMLGDHDTVFGPAEDGGVVLMGVRGRWPDLQSLSWSTDTLFATLRERCRAEGLSAAVLEPLRDVDTLADLLALRTDLSDDRRPTRRALSVWLARQPDLASL
jgi:glycosyltransferase A (GT-A) superfamily protein (DUF2064 family)